MSGPDATAGSIPIFLKHIGTSVPSRLAISMPAASDIPMHAETSKPKYFGAVAVSAPGMNVRYNPTAIKASVPIISPFVRPIRISFSINLNFSFPETASSFRTLIVTARDCVPVFPLISRIKLWKE